MNIYVDESGSMTEYKNVLKNRFFIITFILVENPEKLKKVYKRFIQKYNNALKTLDNGKMFDSDSKFIELKGSSFNPQMKTNFVNYFCKNDLFKILYIKVDNKNVRNQFYDNKARSFNYIVKLALEYLINRNPTDRNIIFNIDERNVRTGTKFQLEEYLLTELLLGRDIADNISVTYFDSQHNKLIQLADVFSNIYYSYLITENYKQELNMMKNNGYIIDIFNFPL